MAGALAAAGAPLADVLAAAQRVAGAMGTLGVASTVCTLPGGWQVTGSSSLPLAHCALYLKLGLGV